VSKQISVMQISKIAWNNFWKEKFSWILLAAFGITFMIIGVAVHLYFPVYMQESAIALSLFGALYTAILHQNGLDAAYGRKLSMIHVSSSILFASLFFIAVSLYSPIPQYLELLLLILPEDFYFLLALNWLIHIIISYLLMRCMFVGMILLEKKCTIKDAFIQSFAMTQHHILLLFGTFIYLAAVLAISTLTIVGYFIVLPYTILMKAFLFKQLDESLKL